MFFLLLVATAFGQTPGTGAISGVVYDPSNRVVSNAEVLAVNEATHVSRSVMTTSEGVFRVPLLLPGAYTITVRAAGFAENTSRSIKVTVSETSSLNVFLVVMRFIGGGTEGFAELDALELAAVEKRLACRAERHRRRYHQGAYAQSKEALSL